MHLKPHNTGIALGVFAGLVHIAWSVLVALGLAQGLIDFVLKIHMIKSVQTILSFDLGSAVMLVIIAFAVGYGFGHIFALVWNRFYSR